MNELMSIVTLVLFLCIEWSLMVDDKHHKYTQRVSLLRPKGFSITVEGSKECKQELKKPYNLRHKRETDASQNITDESHGMYGTYGIINSNENHKKRVQNFTFVKEINKDMNNKFVLVRGRVHASRGRGKQCFLVLRQQEHTIQCFLRVGESVSRQMVKFASNVSRESVVDVFGKVQGTSVEIKGCSKKWVEIIVEELWMVSEAEVLPIQIIDCARSDKDIKDVNIHVSLDKKLDHRVLDLRTPANQAIFRIEAAMTLAFRAALTRKGFIEIFTPKIINAASEGGADVFSISYFENSAYLAQSPQLYKQMAIAADFEKVFTVGAVFRAEKSDTSRHLTEFVGLDLEMAFKYHYSEVLDVIEEAFIEIFKTLQTNFELEIQTVRKQFPAEPFAYSEPPPRLTYSDGLMMLREAGLTINYGSDLTSQDEKLLGTLVKKKYNSDFFVLDKYPIFARPFYIMQNPDNDTLSNSYDMFMRGEEVMSGGQRIHDVGLLRAAVQRHGVDLDKIKAYIDAFRYGCSPHAGGGIGLERTVALFLGLDNVRLTSMFPRDPKRLTP